MSGVHRLDPNLEFRRARPDHKTKQNKQRREVTIVDGTILIPFNSWISDCVDQRRSSIEGCVINEYNSSRIHERVNVEDCHPSCHTPRESRCEWDESLEGMTVTSFGWWYEGSVDRRSNPTTHLPSLVQRNRRSGRRPSPPTSLSSQPTTCT